MEGISLVIALHLPTPAWGAYLQRWHKSIEELKRPYQIVVVHAGTEDDANVASLQANFSDNLSFHACPGVALAGVKLQAGIERATQPLIALLHPDHAYHTDDLAKLVEALAQKHPETGQRVDLASGWRCDKPLLGWRRTWLQWKRYTTRILFGYLPELPPGYSPAVSQGERRKMRIFFACRFQDPHSGLKVFRRNMLEKIAFQAQGRFLLGELIVKGTFLNHLMDEVPLAGKRGLETAGLQIPVEAKKQFQTDFWAVLSHAKFRKPIHPVEVPVEAATP